MILSDGRSFRTNIFNITEFQKCYCVVPSHHAPITHHEALGDTREKTTKLIPRLSKVLSQPLAKASYSNDYRMKIFS